MTCTRAPTPFIRAFAAAVAVAIGSMSLASTGTLKRPCRGDGEDAGAGADVENAAGPHSLRQPVERDQTAARGGVMGGAEGKPGVDLDGVAAPRNLAAVMAAMDDEAPGSDRRPQALGARHPVLRQQPLDAEIPEVARADGRTDEGEQLLERRLLGVMGRDLDLAFAALEQA